MTKRNSPKTRYELQRKQKKLREPRALILIVSEGKKTEPEYFKHLVKKLRVPTANVEICEDSPNDPLGVVSRGIELKKKRKKEARRGEELEYDEVWCVIDTDGHAKLSEALDRANAHGIKLALSNPCFEFWFLLHYEYTSRSFENCDAVQKNLREFVAGYRKNSPPLDDLYQLADDAIRNGAQLEKANEISGSKNPSTGVHRLVSKLTGMS